jgi:tetratricopeptide (TPR) repeat protein
MRVSFASFGRASAAAVALAIGASLVAATPVMAKDAPPPKVVISPEFGKVAEPFQKTLVALDAKKAKLTPDELKAEAAPLVPQLAAMESSVKNPVDREFYGRWEYTVGQMSGDKALQLKGLQNLLDSGRSGKDESTIRIQLGQAAYMAGDYTGTIKILTPVLGVATTQDPVIEWIADSYARLGQPTQGLDALKTAIAARKAANVPVSEGLYTRGKIITINAKLNAEALEWSELVVKAYPTPLNWVNPAELVLFGAPNLTSQDQVDVYRLLDQAGSLKLEPKVISRLYVAYLQLIDARLYPAETIRVAEEGMAEGSLKPDDLFVKDVLTQAHSRLADVRNTLPALAKDAAAAPTGKVAVIVADTYLSFGQADKADEFYTLALTKGVADADKDRVLTRLGIAQIDEGKYPDAKATLAKVGGAHTQIAQAWSIFADQKAAGQ